MQMLVVLSSINLCLKDFLFYKGLKNSGKINWFLFVCLRKIQMVKEHSELPGKGFQIPPQVHQPLCCEHTHVHG